MEILRNTQGRVFVSTGITNPFKYYGSMAVGPIEKPMPAIENVLTIDSKGDVIKIAEIKDTAIQTASASLTGYIPMFSKSSLETLFSKSNSEIQIHYGTCTNPSDVNAFESALILRGVTLTSYGVSEPSTLMPNRAVLQETANVSISNYYRIYTPTFNQVFGEAGILSMLGIGFADSNYCDIGNNNLDILIIFYEFDGFGRFAYSFDNGASWNINPDLFAPNSGGPLDTSLIISKNKIYWSHVYLTDAYVLSVDVNDIINDNSISTSLVFKYPSYSIIKDMSATSKYVWCAGGDGASFVMRIDLSDNTTEIIDNDEIFTGIPVNAIDALHDDFVVVVGGDDNIGLYQNDSFFLSTIGIDSMAFLSDVKVFDENHWVVASDMGLYITTNGGVSWKKTFTVENTCKFTFFDDLVGYAANSQGVYRTMDGGNTWRKVYTAASWTGIHAAAIDKNNPNNLYFLDTFYIFSSL